MKTIYYLLNLILLSALLSACVTAPEFAVKATTPSQQNKGPNPEEQTKLGQAKTAYKSGETQKALTILNEIAKSKSETETYFDSLIFMGKILELKSRSDEALKAYMLIIESPYKYPKRSFAIFRVANIYERKGEVKVALQYADLGLNQKDIVVSDQVIFHKFSYPLLILKEKYFEALKSVDFIIKNSKKQADIETAKDIARNLIGLRLNDNELERLIRNPDLANYYGLAYAELGKNAFYEGHTSEADQYFQEALSLLPKNSPLISDIQDLKRFSDIYKNVDSRAIAILVPLTGPRKALGENILRGLQTSIKESNSDMKLIIKDTEGIPEKAAHLAEKAIFEDHVMGVIGGILSASAEAIVPITSRFGVPFLTLTPKAGLVENFDYTFQNALTLKTAAQKIGEMVVKNGRFKSVAILKSEDNFGESYSSALTQVLLDGGLEVEHVQAYNLKDRGSLNNAIRALVQVDTPEGREIEYKQKLNQWKRENKNSRRLNPPGIEDLLPPVIDFDALFIADSAKNGALVAATLAYFDVEDVPLIGTHLWNSDELVRRAPDQVEGAIFIDSLPPDQAWPSNICTRSLAEALGGREPNTFAVLGYDAARIFRSALRGSRNRVQFKNRLEKLSQVNGCLGSLSMDPTRIVIRPVFALMVKNGAIVRTDLF